jgi:cytoskeleton protein RodZ
MKERGIGELLRNAREARGLSLDEIEAATRIRRRYLEAMEAEAFDQLPGPAYVKGFVRTYATHLGLAADDLAGMYPDLRTGGVSRGFPVEVRITPAMPSSRARRIVTTIAAALVIGLVALAYVLYGQIRQFAVTPPPGTPGAATSTRAPARTGTPGSAPATPAPGGATGSASTSGPAGAPQSTQGNPAPTGTKPSPSAPPAGAPGTAVTPAPGTPGQAGVLIGPLSVAVVATDRSWVRTVADGVTVYEGFLSPGDRQVWQAHRQLTIRVGNAGAIDVTVNGQNIGQLGRAGDVVEKTFTAAASPPQ